MYSKIDGNGETILMILPRMRNPIGNIALCFFFLFKATLAFVNDAVESIKSCGYNRLMHTHAHAHTIKRKRHRHNIIRHLYLYSVSFHPGCPQQQNRRFQKSAK